MATLAALAQTDVDVSTVGQSEDPRVSPPALIQQVAAGGMGPSAEGAVASAAAMAPQTPGLPQAPLTPNETNAVLAQAATAVDASGAPAGLRRMAQQAQQAQATAPPPFGWPLEFSGLDDDERPLAAAGARRPGSSRDGVTEEKDLAGPCYCFGETDIKAVVGTADDTWVGQGHQCAGNRRQIWCSWKR